MQWKHIGRANEIMYILEVARKRGFSESAINYAIGLTTVNNLLILNSYTKGRGVGNCESCKQVCREFFYDCEYYHTKENPAVPDPLKHPYAVAKRMRDSVLAIDPEEVVLADEMFLLGLLHDVAKPLYGVQDHNKIGGKLLRNMGFKYWKEVYFHGNALTDYTSPALDLLNTCDLSVGPNGEEMSTKERLDDIIARYGGQSEQVRSAVSLANRYGLV